MANTSIKFAGGVSAKDAKALASEFRTDPKTFADQLKSRFAAMIRDHTDTALNLQVPFGALEAMPKSSAVELMLKSLQMRDLQAVSYEELEEMYAAKEREETVTKEAEERARKGRQ